MYVQDSHYMSGTRGILTVSYLEEMKNELPDDVVVDSFYSAGPKFYSKGGYKVPDGRVQHCNSEGNNDEQMC